VSFVNWSSEMFLDMCMLSGCDYLPKIQGMGLKTAHRFVREHRTPIKILAALRKSRFNPPEQFFTEFWRARATFLHMRVYDPRSGECIHLNPMTERARDR